MEQDHSAMLIEHWEQRLIDTETSMSIALAALTKLYEKQSGQLPLWEEQ